MCEFDKVLILVSDSISLNQHMSVDDFKNIYMWEWSHRIIGRIIGMAFVLPSFYFLARGHVAKGTKWKIWAIALGIGFQGALGWFMVQSGLSAPDTHSSVEVKAPGHQSAHPYPLQDTTTEWHPRVSQFRLAAHLGTAFAVYLGMLHTGITILRDYRLANQQGKVSGWSMDVKGNLDRLMTTLSSPAVRRFRYASRSLFGLIFVTAMSGALVAGLDAGLVYSEFPFMGESLIPPVDELLDPKYTWGSHKLSQIPDEKLSARLVLGNVSQNPVTVQLVHRCLAITTFFGAVGLAFYSRRLSSKTILQSSQHIRSAVLPPNTHRLAMSVSVMAALQASLGISTLIYLVPIELASAHQAGSVALLSLITALLASLRSPRNAALLIKATSKSTTNVQGVVSKLSDAHQAHVIQRALKRVSLTSR